MNNILTASGWAFGLLETGADGRIAAIRARPVGAPLPGYGYLLPGFVDLHVHGAGGVDLMDGGEAAQQVAASLAASGTTAFLATTMTAPEAELREATAAIGRVERRERPAHCARLLGVHLEGPFLNPGQLGAQPPHARRAQDGEIDTLLALASVRLVTLAPELEGQLDTIRWLVRRGIRVQLGHSSGSYEQGVAALQCGASGFAHLFNAMSGLHHRAPGLVGAALAHAEYAEMIPDLAHLHAGAMRAALRAIPRLYCVSDACAATGMPDGAYRLGAQRVFRRPGQAGARLADGRLAASTLTLDAALRNLVKLGLSIADASDRVSRFPADFLGLPERGRLAPGAWADTVRLDPELRVEAVTIEGRTVERAAPSRRQPPESRPESWSESRPDPRPCTEAGHV
ncbi:N-acetylglucosamine-6-phosphate deacetylase [Burkholderia gladioli]|uniref:N-acetylglucosamine-6-phosphate deacetylase n=1 Tax=Burkholderia gladioli TaxID=28095 RepID=UPI00163E68D4|nr:N-acetylglucosamine-6-phosphate deacetylase [Burkholderia gladioli]